MGSAIFFLLLSLSLSLFISLQPLILVSADSDLIQKTCKVTKHCDLCLSSLRSNPKSSDMDTKGLAVLMVGVGIANATATSSYLSSQSLSSTNDTVLKRVLKECADKYTYAGDALQASVQNLATEDYDYAFMNIKAAADYPNACHNAFRRFPGMVYPPELARREDGLKQICDVILDIIDHIGW